MTEFSENQKKYIVRHDHLMTINDIAIRLSCAPQEVLSCYSEMVDTGEYIKYKKPNLWANRGKKYER